MVRNHLVANDLASCLRDDDVVFQTHTSKVSERFDDGKYYTEIYAANKQLIEDVAKAWGKPNSAKGYYLFAKTPGGEVVKLTIPSAAAAKAVKKASKKKKRNAKIAKKIQNMAEALTYTDVASGQSDSLSSLQCLEGQQ